MKDNNNYTDMLDDDIENEESEFLEESSSGAASIKTHIGTMFGHLLKFKYQPEKQTSSWVRTISRINETIIRKWNKLSTTERNKITGDIDNYLDKCFSYALSMYFNNTEKQLKISRPLDWDWDFVFNRRRIKKFLMDNINYSIWIDDIRSTIEDEFRN